MGVSGTGKTTIGAGIAERLGMEFIEGDSFHPRANIDKMSSGTPLDDDDRKPWLHAIADEIHRLDSAEVSSVTACSALRRIYRDWLRAGDKDIFFVHLDTAFDVLLERMEKRTHFMPPSLLQSQFDTLEPLERDENGLVISDDQSIDAVIQTAVEGIDHWFAAQ